MRFQLITISSILIFGFFMVNSVHAQIDPLSEIRFLQSGVLHHSENQFNISNDVSIREFSNGNIIRVSGITIEGFPYITYSKILENTIDTHGIIFINGEFTRLSFIEKPIEVKDVDEKKNDLTIVPQYTQRVYSKQFVLVDVKIFEKEQNKYINFNQNYGYVSNSNIQVIVTDENNIEIFSTTGITNDKGLFETRYLVPDNSKRETLTITINAENAKSMSSKILQVFTLGNIPSDGGP